MGNTVNKPQDFDIDVKNIIYDKNIKTYTDALRCSITKFRNSDVNHLIGYTEERTFTITSFEKYENLYYYYTNNVFFDCDIIEKLKVITKGNEGFSETQSCIDNPKSSEDEKIKLFIEINKNIYDTNDPFRIITSSLYGKNIKFIFCTSSPIVNQICVSYDAYVASNKYRYYLLYHRIIYDNIEYDNGKITHISPYTNSKVNTICRKYFENIISCKIDDKIE
jgi:hypothetical protein